MTGNGQTPFERTNSAEQELSFKSLTARSIRRNTPAARDGRFLTEGAYNNLSLILSDQCPWETELRSAGNNPTVLKGSAINQLEKAETAILNIRRNLTDDGNLPGKIPGMVVSEILLNAVSHRDYRDPSPITVDISPGGVTVSSPGGNGRCGVSFRERTRNPDLADVLDALGFKNTNMRGLTGVMRAYDSCQYHPEFRFGEGRVTIVLPAMINLGSVAEGRKCNIIRTIMSLGTASEKNISEVLSLRPQTVREILRKMEDEGLLFSMYSGKTKYIFLTDRKYWTEREAVQSETLREMTANNKRGRYKRKLRQRD